MINQIFPEAVSKIGVSVRSQSILEKDESTVFQEISNELSASASFSEFVKRYGLVRSIGAVLAKRWCIVRLWLCREANLILVCVKNYEKVAKVSLTRLVCASYLHIALVRRVIDKLAQSLQK